MERHVDISIVFCCCIACLGLWAISAAEPEAATASASLPALVAVANLPAVICLLLAIISSAVFELLPTRARVAAPLALCTAVALLPGGICLLPVAAYELMRCIHNEPPERYALAAVPLSFLAALAIHPVGPSTAALCAIVNVLSCLLSARTSRLLAQRRMAQRIRDDLQRQSLSLQRENAELEQKVSRLREPGRDAEGDAVLGRPEVFSQLTEREYEVVRLIADGLDNHEIAAAAFISEGTVRNRISSVLSKTGLKNRTQIAVAWWRAHP